MSTVIEIHSKPPAPSDSAVIEVVRRYSEARAAFDTARAVDAPDADRDAAYDRESRAYAAMMAATPATAAGWLVLIERLLESEADKDLFASAASPEQISAFLAKLKEYFAQAVRNSEPIAPE